MCPAHVADVVPEHEGCETERGVFAVADGVLTCPGEITHGVLVDCGDRDRGEIA